jgi:hypothetical protein
MCEHLPVIFTAFFDVDDEELLQPKGKLYNVVPFHSRLKEWAGKLGPELFAVKPIFRVVENVLLHSKLVSLLVAR